MSTTDLFTAARAAALFTSYLSISAQPGRADVTTAICHAVRTHGGTRGCSVEVAGVYGDYPETAASRMRWALGIIHGLQPKAPKPRHTDALRVSPTSTIQE